MLNFILRRTWLKSFTKEEQDMCLTLRGYVILNSFIDALQVALMMFPPILIALKLFECVIKKDENIIWMIVGILMMIYIFLWIYLMKNHKYEIEEFKEFLFSKLYFYLFTFKGKAISNADWQTIKNLDEKCYYHIMEQECKSYCYNACFRILQCLKKGSMKFVTVLNPGRDGRKTIHVLYVNNGWCFDTYSIKQYPLKNIMKIFKAEEYMEFSYRDIVGKTYDEFRKEHYFELKEWCKKNNVEQHW